MSDLADRLAATLRHLSTDAAPHRRLELARMTALTDTDSVHSLIDRLEWSRNQARHFGLEVDDQASDFDRANALRRRVSAAGDYPIACLATALDELPELSRDAQAALAALLAELAAERSRAPSREWWADAAQIAGRGCVSLPDAMAAFKAAIADKDAEIARLTSECDAVADERDAIVAAVNDLPIVEDDDIPGGRAGAIATVRNAVDMIDSMDAEIARLRDLRCDCDEESSQHDPACITMVRERCEAMSAEIARLKAESSTVGGLLASAPELSDFEVPSLVARIGAVYDLTIRAGRARAIAAMHGAEATIVSIDEAATRGPIGGQPVTDPAKIGGAP